MDCGSFYGGVSTPYPRCRTHSGEDPLFNEVSRDFMGEIGRAEYRQPCGCSLEPDTR